MKRKIANFNSFMKTRRLNEMEEMDNEFAMSMDAYSEDPEEMDELEEDPDLDLDEEGAEEEELTMEDLKAIVDDLEERLSALEGGGEEGEEEEAEEGEEEEAEEGEEEEGEEI
jgi:septum formation inhibitor MinC